MCLLNSSHPAPEMPGNSSFLHTFTIHRLVTTTNRPGVDIAAVVCHDLSDHALLLQVVKCCSGERAVDFEAIDKHGDGDEAVGLHVFLQLFGGVLIEDYGVVGLVLDCLSYDVSDSCICNATIETDGIVEEEFVIVVSYPCPWTTSSFASCHRLLLVPAFTSISAHSFAISMRIPFWKMCG